MTYHSQNKFMSQSHPFDDIGHDNSYNEFNDNDLHHDDFLKVITNLLNQSSSRPHLDFRTLVDFLLTSCLTLKNSQKRDLTIQDLSIFPSNNLQILIVKSEEKFYGCLRHKYINYCLHTALAVYLFSRLHIPDNYGTTEMTDDSRNSSPRLNAESLESSSPSPIISNINPNSQTGSICGSGPGSGPGSQHGSISASVPGSISGSISGSAGGSLPGSGSLNPQIGQPIQNSITLSPKSKKLQNFIESRVLKGNNKLQSITYTQQHKWAVKALEKSRIPTNSVNILKFIPSRAEPSSNTISNISPEILVKNAGFDSIDDYSITRDIEPPQELADMIFPFINDDSKFDIFTVRIKNVLSMLRRSLIQDMVVIKEFFPNNPLSKHPMFNNSLFFEFSHKVRNSINLNNEIIPVAISNAKSPSSPRYSSDDTLIKSLLEVQLRHENQIMLLTNQMHGFVGFQQNFLNEFKQLIQNNDKDKIIEKLDKSSNDLNVMVPPFYNIQQAQEMPGYPVKQEPSSPEVKPEVMNRQMSNDQIYPPSSQQQPPQPQPPQPQQPQPPIQPPVHGNIPPVPMSMMMPMHMMPHQPINHIHHINQMNQITMSPINQTNQMNQINIPLQQYPNIPNQVPRFPSIPGVQILPPNMPMSDQVLARRNALNRRLSRQATSVYEMWDDFKSLEKELEDNEVSITEWLKLHGSSERQFRHTRSKIIRFIENESKRTGKSIGEVKDRLHNKMRDRAKPWTLDEVQRMLTSGKKIDLS